MQVSPAEGGLRQSQGRRAQAGAAGQDDGVLQDTERLEEEVDCLLQCSRINYFVFVVPHRAVIRSAQLYKTFKSLFRFPVPPYPPSSTFHLPNRKFPT